MRHSTRPSRRTAGAGLQAALLVAVLLGLVGGGARRLDAVQTAQVAALDGGTWSGRLREADTAMVAGDWDRSVRTLQQVVQFGGDRLLPLEDEPVDQDPAAEDGEPEEPRVVVRPGVRPGLRDPQEALRVRAARDAEALAARGTRGGGRVYITAAEMARRRIAALPEPGRVAYRRIFEPVARQLLAAALSRDDEAALWIVAQDFATTDSGFRAREVLGERTFVNGSFRRALRLFEGLVADVAAGRAPADTEPGRLTSIQLRYLAALRALGETAAYDEARRRAVRSGLATTVLTALEARVRAGTPTDVVVISGLDSAGSAPVHTLPSIPAVDGRWTVEWESPYWARPEEGVETLYLHYGYRFMEPSRFLNWVPGIGDDSIFISGVFHLWKLDHHGRLRGKYSKPGTPLVALTFKEKSDSPLYSATVADDIVYSHGLTDLVQATAYMQYLIQEDLPTRALIARNAHSGRVLWDTRHLAMGSPEDPKPLSVTTPPLVRGDRVYVGGFFKAGFFTSVVAALDASTGEPVWRTQLASDQMELTMFGEPAREPFAAILLEEEGVLYAVSQLGVVAALEARDGTIRWLTTYDSIARSPTLGRWPDLREIVWGTSMPLLVDGVLYVAPRDSNFFLAIDSGLRPPQSLAGVAPGVAAPGPAGRLEPEGGRVLASYYNLGGRLRDVLGYRQGRVYFSGPDGVQALDVTRALDAGRIVRVSNRDGGARGGKIHGKAAMTDRGVVFSNGAVLGLIDYDLETAVSLTPGAFPESDNGSHSGNVTIWNGRILLTSRDMVSCFAPAPPPREEDL